MKKEYNSYCPVCGTLLYHKNVARWDDEKIRTDVFGHAWCKECAENFDNEEHGE